MKSFRSFARLKAHLQCSPVDTLARLEGPHDTIGVWRSLGRDARPQIVGEVDFTQASGGEFSAEDIVPRGDVGAFFDMVGDGSGGLVVHSGRVDLPCLGEFHGLALLVSADVRVDELDAGAGTAVGCGVGTASGDGQYALVGGLGYSESGWHRAFGFTSSGSALTYGGSLVDRASGVVEGDAVTMFRASFASDPSSGAGGYVCGCYAPGDVAPSQQTGHNSSSCRTGDVDHVVTVDSLYCTLTVQRVRVSQ